MKISVVIPTHRRHELVARAVQSALFACEASDEVVVVCDQDHFARDFLFSRFSDNRLIIENNQGVRGASGARNFAVSIASGDLILFLDDDDEMVEGYPNKVRISYIEEGASWGFSNHFIRTSNEEDLILGDRLGWLGGFPNRKISFRRRIAGLGTGFWINRSMFLKIGGLNEDLILDEDTDLCCRLLSIGHQPWFISSPGVIVDRSPNVHRLTVNSSDEVRARCSLFTFVNNVAALQSFAGAEYYLALRAQKSIIRSGKYSLLTEVYRRVCLTTKIFLVAKRFSYFVRRKV
jgi:glycosyltransferase involved in cell wall biosynthesis